MKTLYLFHHFDSKLPYNSFILATKKLQSTSFCVCSRYCGAYFQQI